MAASGRALIAGASRGLGLAIAEQYLERGWHVTGTVRGAAAGLDALRDRFPARLDVELLDITVPEQIAALFARLADVRFDLLWVNAGTTHAREETIANMSTEEFVRVMVTNALAPMRVVESLGELVTAEGTIAVMSSGQGSVADNTGGGWEVYRASKAALNQLMRSYAARHRDDLRTLLLLAPGWIRTDMGGPSAAFSVEEAIPELVATVEAQRGKGGLQYLDRFGKAVNW